MPSRSADAPREAGSRFGRALQRAAIFLVFIPFSILVTQNLVRWQAADLTRWFVNGPHQREAKDIAFAAYEIAADGLFLTDFKPFDAAIPEAEANRFTIEIEAKIDVWSGLFVKLGGTPAAVEFTLGPEDAPRFVTGKTNRIAIEARPGHIELLVNGERLRSVERGAGTFDSLSLVDLESVLYIRSVTGEADGRRVMRIDLTPALSSIFSRAVFALALAFCGLALTAIDAKASGRTQGLESAGRVLFFTTPLWAGTLFPVAVDSREAFWPFLAISLIGLADSWTTNFLTKAQRRFQAVLVASAFVGLSIAFSRRFGLAPTAGFLAWALAAILIVVRALKNPVDHAGAHGRSIKWLAACWFPAAMWPAAQAAAGREFVPGLAIALGFSSAVMLFLRIFERRRTVRAYTAVTLFLALTALGAAELTARTSAAEWRLRPSAVTGVKGWNEFLKIMRDSPKPGDGVPADFASKYFRSGATPVERAPDTFRIMVVGASTTYGIGIERNEQTFSGRLEACLNRPGVRKRVEVINAGQTGYNLFMLLQLFEPSEVAYQPDLVVLYIGTIDAHVILGPFTFHELWRQRLDTFSRLNDSWSAMDRASAEEAAKVRAGPAWVPAVQSELRNFRLYNALVKEITRLRRGPFSPLAARLGALKDINPAEDYRENLRRMIRLCKDYGIPLLLVDEVDFWSAPGRNPKRDVVSGIMKQEAAAAGLGYLDLWTEYHKRPDAASLFFPTPPLLNHPNLKGHEEIAKSLCGNLMNNGYAPSVTDE